MLGQPFPVASPSTDDASMDATRQTAAGVTLGDERFEPPEPLEPFDFREPSDPDRRPLLSLLPLLSFFRLSFLSLPRELRDPDLAGVALRGFCLPAWENSQSFPRLQRPAFQYLHVILDLSLPSRLVERPLLGFRVFFGGVSCLYVQFSLVQLPLFHATQ